MEAISQILDQECRQIDRNLIDPHVVSDLISAIPLQRLLAFSEVLRNGCHEAIKELRDVSGSSGDTAAVAHRVKGMVGNLGLRTLCEIATNLEQSEAWPSEARLSAVAEFEARLEDSLSAFRAELSR